MKKWIAVFGIVLLCFGIAACFPRENPSTPGTSTPGSSSSSISSSVTDPGSTGTTTNPTTPTTSRPTTHPTTRPTFPTTRPTEPSIPSVITGWQQQADKWYFFDESGHMVTGLLQIDEDMYYFGQDGAMHTGWLELNDARYYMGTDGKMQTGFIQVEDIGYYMDANGVMQTGWLDIGNDRYYFWEDGAMHIGWFFQDDKMYYMKENGAMAKGMVEIEGEKNYFTSTGAFILLVNPWNYLPEGYEPELTKLSKYCYTSKKVDASCYDALVKMLDDCKAAGNDPLVCSAYRTIEDQEKLFENKVERVMKQGYDREEAERIAATEVARPGTSEHHLGLAVDIVSYSNQNLDSSQEKTATQKWLMEHSWEYGFILRYPKGTTDSTGIIYEPWHYRYVGLELAAELHELDMTLEEYLQMLTDEANT